MHSSSWFILISLSLFLLLSPSNASSAEFKPPMGACIDVKGESELIKAISSTPMSLVVFYTTVEPKLKDSWLRVRFEISNVSKKLEKDHVPFKIYLMDTDDYPEVKKTFNIQPKPTIIMYTYGRGREQLFTEKGFEKLLMDWIMNNYMQSSKEIFAEEKIQKVLSEHCHTILFFGSEKSENFKNFLHASLIMEDSPMFYHVFEEELIQRFAPGGKPETIVFYEGYGQEKFEYDIESLGNDPETIKDFVLHNLYHGQFDHSYKLHEKIFEERIPTMLLAVSGDQRSLKAQDALDLVEEELRRKILVSVADIRDPDFRKYYGLKTIREEDLPALFIFSFYNQTSRAVYQYKGPEITANSIKQFFRQWKDKSIKPLISKVERSHYAPKKTDSELVKVKKPIQISQ